jgi:predicted kinase
MRLIVLVGLPGSGKSTWAKSNALPVLSSDEIRNLLADDPTNQNIHHKVFATLRYLLRQRLELRRPVTCIDATNLTPKERRPYVRIGEAYGCEVEAVFFDVPLTVCHARNAARSRVVPAEALEKMAAKMRLPSLEEGFQRITVVAG